MKQYGIILLYQTRDAMAAEKSAKSKGLAVRIISTPGSLKATCGFCLQYSIPEEAAVRAVLQEGAWPAEGWYHAVQTGLFITYTPVQEDANG